MKNYKLRNPQAIEEDLDNSTKNDDEDDETNDNQFNEINILKSLLAVMQPNETVVRAIKRLGAAATR